MSGGSWDYFYYKLEDVADRLRESKDPLRRAFGDHLALCVTALHDIEWVDSADYTKGEEAPAIEKALGVNATRLELEQLVADARKCIGRMQELLARTSEEPKKSGG